MTVGIRMEIAGHYHIFRRREPPEIRELRAGAGGIPKARSREEIIKAVHVSE
jgi:hypothetical protein